MQSRFIRLVTLITAIYCVYHYRYRIVNWLMSYPVARKLVVRTSFSIPGVRERFLQGAFRSTFS